MKEKLFNYIINNAPITDKKSVIDFFSKNDKVYTKKIPIDADDILIDGCQVKYVSLTSINGKFDDVTPNDIRVNFKNAFDIWVNVYISSLSELDIKKIVKWLDLKQHEHTT